MIAILSSPSRRGSLSQLPASLHASYRMIAIVATILFAAAAANPAIAQSLSGFTYNGQVYTSYQSNEYQQTPQGPQGIAAIRANGTSYGAVMVTQYQLTSTSNTIAPETVNSPGYDPNKDPLSPTDASVVAAIQNMHSQGITVFLKPQVDSEDGVFRGNFAPTNVADWFASYQTFILHYAEIASQNNVGGLIIGTELASLTKSAYRSYWLNIIAQLRASYPNLTLAYGANATYSADEFTTVSFWDKIDIIGVDGYFPLTNHADPTVAELVAAWTNNKDGFNIVAALKSLQSSYNKPLVFTEIGYVSAPGTNETPYASAAAGATYDPTEQNNCYEAFFEVFSQQSSWMKGVFWWAWSVSPPGSTDTGYTPQNKPAADTTLVKWYGSTTQGFTLAPSTLLLTVGQGLQVPATISVTNLGGFTGSVVLAASGLPSGVTASFAAGSTGTQVMTLTASSAATAGPATITITGTSGSLMATTAIAVMVEGATAQTIIFDNPGAQSVGTPLTLSATASSGLPVSFLSTTLNVCTVSNGSATFSAAGTCSITASQAGNSVYSSAPNVLQSFAVTTLTAVPVPAANDILVSQVNWLGFLNGNASTSGNPAGGSFATTSKHQVVDANTNDLLLFDEVTGVTTTLGPWSSAGAVAVDSRDNIYIGNLYGPVNVIVKVPYTGASTNKGYAAFTTPTASTPACTSTSTTECALPITSQVNPGSMTFDANGNLFFASAGSGGTSGNSIYECSALCLAGTSALVQVYQEPTAQNPPSTTSGQLLVGGLAIDPSGNIFFTDSSIYVDPNYAITSFYSNLNELAVSTGAGYGGATTGYAATPSVLYTVTPATVGTFDNQLDGVTINAKSGTVYFGDGNDGVFAFPNSGSAIPTANGQPTALYTVSTQGAKTLTIDAQGNLYFITYSTVINASGGDTVGQIALNNVIVPASAVGTAVSPSTKLNPVTTLLNDTTCSSTPAPSVTFSGTSSTASATAATTGTCASTLAGGSAFATSISFTPSAGGTDTISLSATDQASNSGTVTITGVGQATVMAQTITFAAPPTQSVGTPLTLSATASSGLAVTFTSTTHAVCTVSGNVATFVAAGTCTIDANQAGNASYSAAPQMQQSFSVITAPSFTVAPTSSTLSITAGASGSDTITVTPANGFNGSVTLAASGLPNGVTASFATNPTSGSSVLTLIASTTATAGSATVTVTGTSSTLTSFTTIAVTVTAAPNFTLAPATPTLSVAAGASGTNTITILPTNGFTGNVSLAASGLPSGVTASFATNPATATSVLTITASAAAAPGIATVTITGTSGTLTASTTVVLTLAPAQSFTLAPAVLALSVAAGASSSDTITISPANGFTGSVTLSASGFPSGITASFATNPTTATSVLTLTANAAATPGASSILITGTSGTVTSSTTIALTVSKAPSFTVAPSAASVAFIQGGTASSTITVSPADGFSGIVTLAASALPSGVTATFATNPATASSVVTFTATATATLGTATVTVTGTSGTLIASTVIAVTINPAPSFTLAPGSSSSPTVMPGGTTNETISISGSGGFMGTVSLSAAISSSPQGAQDPPTLSFGGTSPVTVNANGGNATLTISTTAATSAALEYPNHRSHFLEIPCGVLACLFLFGVPARGRRWPALFGTVTLLFALTGAMTGCGGGSTPHPTGNPGTTAGNYTVTVTATSGATTATLPITVIVQ